MDTVPADAAGDSAEMVACVQRAQAGDSVAFARLYHAFGRAVHGIVLAHAGPAEAEDLTQEVFLAAFSRLPSLRDAAAFPGWLSAAARHRAIDARRRRRPAPQPLPDLAVDTGAPPEAAARGELRQRVLALIQQLGAAYRETLVLRFVEGLTGPEIAARTGMTHGSVRVNLSRGMALLRPLLLEAGLG